MNIFNQQGQHVKNQYNAGGNIDFTHPNNEGDLNVALDQLIVIIKKAASDGIIDATTASAVQNELNSASSSGEKNTIVKHLSKATDILKGVSAAEGLVNTIKSLINSVGNWFL